MYKVNSSLHFSHGAATVGSRETDPQWVPNTDVYLVEGGVTVTVELAGMRREDLQLMVDGNRLRISGQRPDGCRKSQCKFLVMEINYGSFETVIELPKGYDLSQAKAAYENGFLRVEVPVAESSSRRIQIPIKGN